MQTTRIWFRYSMHQCVCSFRKAARETHQAPEDVWYFISHPVIHSMWWVYICFSTELGVHDRRVDAWGVGSLELQHGCGIQFIRWDCILQTHLLDPMQDHPRNVADPGKWWRMVLAQVCLHTHTHILIYTYLMAAQHLFLSVSVSCIKHTHTNQSNLLFFFRFLSCIIRGPLCFHAFWCHF